MANYYSTYRTNLFKVKNIEDFTHLMDKVSAEDLEYWSETVDNELLCGFGGYGGISGIVDSENDDESYDDFLSELQKLLPDNEVILLTEVGNEKLRYVGGMVTVITKDRISCKSVDDLAESFAREVSWNEQLEFNY